MIKNNISTQSLLSTLWTFVLFNMIFRDLHEFVNEGYIEEMMSLRIPEAEMLLYGILLEIPISMVLLSKILKNKANKWSNLVAASITLLGMLSTLPTGDMDDIFFTIVNSIALITILRMAWKLSPQHGKTN